MSGFFLLQKNIFTKIQHTSEKVSKDFMKKLLIGLLAISSVSGYGDCSEAYHRASHHRDIRNEIIIGVTWVGTGTATVILSGGATASLLFVANQITVGAAWPITDFKRQGEDIYNNNFDKLLIAFSGAKSGLENKHLNKILNKSIKKSGLEHSPELEAEAKVILINGFENETFCPVVKMRKDGTEKRSVFNQSALVEYISLNLNLK